MYDGLLNLNSSGANPLSHSSVRKGSLPPINDP